MRRQQALQQAAGVHHSSNITTASNNLKNASQPPATYDARSSQKPTVHEPKSTDCNATATATATANDGTT